jgi:hypothetical protein
MSRNQVRLQIESSKPFAGGMAFGDAGSYEWLQGKVHCAIDPDEPGLPYICDLSLAPRNADGLVEFSSTLDIVKPVEITRGNRRIFYEFSNRGGKAMLGLNYGRGADWTSPEIAGDGFLMRHGLHLRLVGLARRPHRPRQQLRRLPA